FPAAWRTECLSRAIHPTESRWRLAAGRPRDCLPENPRCGSAIAGYAAAAYRASAIPFAQTRESTSPLDLPATIFHHTALSESPEWLNSSSWTRCETRYRLLRPHLIPDPEHRMPPDEPPGYQ